MSWSRKHVSPAWTHLNRASLRTRSSVFPDSSNRRMASAMSPVPLAEDDHATPPSASTAPPACTGRDEMGTTSGPRSRAGISTTSARRRSTFRPRSRAETSASTTTPSDRFPVESGTAMTLLRLRTGRLLSALLLETSRGLLRQRLDLSITFTSRLASEHVAHSEYRHTLQAQRCSLRRTDDKTALAAVMVSALTAAVRPDFASDFASTRSVTGWTALSHMLFRRKSPI